jgi:chromosome segregation ATPase
MTSPDALIRELRERAEQRHHQYGTPKEGFVEWKAAAALEAKDTELSRLSARVEELEGERDAAREAWRTEADNHDKTHKRAAAMREALEEIRDGLRSDMRVWLPIGEDGPDGKPLRGEGPGLREYIARALTKE